MSRTNPFQVPRVVIVVFVVVGLTGSLTAQSGGYFDTDSAKAVAAKKSRPQELIAPKDRDEDRPSTAETPTDSRPFLQTPLSQVSFASPFGRDHAFVPMDGGVILFPEQLFASSPKTATYSATDLRHGHLFFEDALLERHGCSRRPLVQDAISGSRILTHAIKLPLTRCGRRALRGR